MAILTLLLLLLLAGVAQASGSACPGQSYRCGAVEVRYPFWLDNGQDIHCGYPSLRLECRRDTPVLRLPSGNYAITRLLYGDRRISLFDIAASNTTCPHVAGRNLTLPPPLSLTANNRNITFLLDCSFVGVNADHIVPCLQNGEKNSYVFPHGVVHGIAVVARLCQQIVGMPVVKPFGDVVTALRTGFELRWRPAAAGVECVGCENAGGMCGHRRETVHVPWTFSCFRTTAATISVNKESKVLKIALPISASLLILPCLCLLWIYKSRGERRINNVQNKELGEGELELPSISFEDINTATNNFSNHNILGQGGFGTVYKGLLESGKEVAVKRLGTRSRQGDSEFKTELDLIAKLQHKNLVRLLGYCIHDGEKLILYEYLPNKSLDAFLFDASRRSMFDWPTRLKVIKGVARGILYLHQDSRLTVIHRDLKSSNILLDAEMNPKISDFGMARIFGGNEEQAKTIRVAGTPGYLSPEYAMNGVFSVMSGTYSFGVLVLEIVGGVKISSPHLTKDFPSLTAYAWNLWKDGNAKALVDSTIVNNCTLEEVYDVFR